MEKRLKTHLKNEGIREDTINILEAQQLIDHDLLKEVEISLLINVCSLKIGEAMNVKKIVSMYEPLPMRGESYDLQQVELDEAWEPIDQPETLVGQSEAECVTEVSGTSSNAANSPTSPFIYEERKNRVLFRDYKLPEKFSPNVELALKSGSLTGNQRSEFIRDICTNISANGVYYLNKIERNQVAAAIVSKYPALKDPIGSGLGSWEESIRNRFKHVRKYDAKKRKHLEYASVEKSVPNVAVVKRTRRTDFWNEVPTSTNNDKMVADHITELQKECSRPLTKQDVPKLRHLMVLTYPYRRSQILTKPVPVKELINQYPPLATVTGIRHEFCRIIKDEDAMKDMKDRFSKYKSAIVEFCKKQVRPSPFIKNMLQSLKEEVNKETASVENLEKTFAMMVLPRLLKKKNKNSENTLSLIEILNEDDDLNEHVRRTTYPMLIGVGDTPFKLDVLQICMEGEKFLDVTTYGSDTVLLCLYSLYYVFSIAYPLDHKDFFNFVDSVIAGLQSNEAVKRITIQKFTKELTPYLPG